MTSIEISPLVETTPLGFFCNVTGETISQTSWLTLAQKLKSTVLSPDYDLTINLVSDDEIKKLNHQWRNFDKVTDVLSFPYSDLEGELFLAPNYILASYHKYERGLGNYVLFIYVHALHHLAGYEHGLDMESAEAKIRSEFLIDR